MISILMMSCLPPRPPGISCALLRIQEGDLARTRKSILGWWYVSRLLLIKAVQPSTGDVVYDQFEDGFMRAEFETRALHLQPCEVIIAGELTNATKKVLSHLSINTYDPSSRSDLETLTPTPFALNMSSDRKQLTLQLRELNPSMHLRRITQPPSWKRFWNSLD
jgi:hypothetical protein